MISKWVGCTLPAPLPSKAKAALPQEAKEKVLLSYKCNLIDEDIAAGHPDMGGILFGPPQAVKNAVFPGILVITRKQLLFIEQMQGIWNPKDEYNCREIIPLESIQAMSVFKHWKGGLRINVSYEESGGKHDRGFTGKKRVVLDDIKGIIEKHRSKRVKVFEEEKKKERIQVVLDFSFLKHQLEKGGITLTTIKCPNCSGDVQIPEHGDIFKCQYCGSKVKAVDIFERMKGLISSL